MYLNKPNPDKTFGVRKIGGHHYIGETHVIIHKNNTIIDDEKFEGTPGLWELIVSKNPTDYTNKDHENYKRIMVKTNVLHRYYNPKSPTQEAVIVINGIIYLVKFGKKEENTKEVELLL